MADFFSAIVYREFKEKKKITSPPLLLKLKKEKRLNKVEELNLRRRRWILLRSKLELKL